MTIIYTTFKLLSYFVLKVGGDGSYMILYELIIIENQNYKKHLLCIYH